MPIDEPGSLLLERAKTVAIPKWRPWGPGLSGALRNIPMDRDIWMVVRAGVQGDWYAAGWFAQHGGSWSIGRGLICPANGAQEFQLWMVPDSEDTGLLVLLHDKQLGKSTWAVDMPPGATLEFNVDVVVESSLGGC
jgi:hypothetical protein